MTKSEIEAKIEYKKTIGDTYPGGFKPIRFTKVKYKACPYAHIDIRQFQRGYDANDEEAFFPTKKGFRFPERDFRKVLRKYTLLPETYLHALILEKCFPLLEAGHYESAVLQAFKAIETSVRKKYTPLLRLSA